MNKEKWLKYSLVLFTLLRKIRREGLMAIEEDIEFPEKSKILNIVDNKHHWFITDICRLMIGGTLEPEDLEQYCDLVMDNEGSIENKTALRFISIALLSACRGYSPQVSIEFARATIPFKNKPSFNEVEEYLKANKSEPWLNKEPEAMEMVLHRIMNYLKGTK